MIPNPFVLVCAGVPSFDFVGFLYHMYIFGGQKRAVAIVACCPGVWHCIIWLSQFDDGPIVTSWAWPPHLRRSNVSGGLDEPKPMLAFTGKELGVGDHIFKFSVADQTDFVVTSAFVGDPRVQRMHYGMDGWLIVDAVFYILLCKLSFISHNEARFTYSLQMQRFPNGWRWID